MKSLFFFAALFAGTVYADYRLQTLEQAHQLFRTATHASEYAEAARQYEYLVEEEGIRNGHLFYTLGNSWFMADDLGRAILNYRRAECYLPRNADLQHNLQTALKMRTDLIPAKEPSPLGNLFLGGSPVLRGGLFGGCWLLFWGGWVWQRRSPRKEVRFATAGAGLLSALLLASLVAEAALKRQAEPGVVLAQSIIVRKGNGEMYAPAFQEPLHAGTEFHRLETRQAWWKIQLADGSSCWIPSTAASLVALR